MKLSIMFLYWLDMVKNTGGNLNPLPNIIWIERTFKKTYKQARFINRMFTKWITEGNIYLQGEICNTSAMFNPCNL